MSFSVAVVIASFILVGTAIAIGVFIASRRRAAKDDELKRSAATRGWKFESTSERGYRVHRWIGTTEGVPWRAESLRYTSGNNRQRPHLARWHGDFSPGVTAPIVCVGMPAGKDTPAFSVAPGDSLLAKLAVKAAGFAFDKALDVYFGGVLGKQVDAAAMHRVNTTLAGFVVMAVNKDEAARILSQGLERSLTDASHDQSSVFAKGDRPWVLLMPHGISLARTEPFRDLADVDSFVRAGLALTRSSKFARPFA
jgi:hypothetical protein